MHKSTNFPELQVSPIDERYVSYTWFVRQPTSAKIRWL